MNRYIAILITLLLVSSLSLAQTPEHYFKIAAENNPGLKAVYNEYEAALQKVPQANALADPVFSFGYFISPVETRLGPQQAKFSLVQMFPWFGTLKAEGNAAALMAEAKFQRFIDARNRLFFRVAAAYYSVYELKDLIRIEQENIELLESYKTIAGQNVKTATGNMVDVLRVDIMLNDAQTNLEILSQKVKPLRTVFNSLLNRDADEYVVLGSDLKTKALWDNYRKDSLIAVNPELKAIDLKIQAGKASELIAQKKSMPRLGVGLDYVVVGERSDLSMPDNGKDVVMPMISVSVPVFRKKFKASVKEAQLIQESYENRKKELANSLISDYEMVWFEVQKQQKLLSLYEQQIKTTEQSLNLLLVSYENSGREFEEVLSMQQQLLKYRKMNSTALTQLYTALAKINYLTSKVY